VQALVGGGGGKKEGIENSSFRRSLAVGGRKKGDTGFNDPVATQGGKKIWEEKRVTCPQRKRPYRLFAVSGVEEKPEQ